MKTEQVPIPHDLPFGTGRRVTAESIAFDAALAAGQALKLTDLPPMSRDQTRNLYNMLRHRAVLRGYSFHWRRIDAQTVVVWGTKKAVES